MKHLLTYKLFESIEDFINVVANKLNITTNNKSIQKGTFKN